MSALFQVGGPVVKLEEYVLPLDDEELASVERTYGVYMDDFKLSLARLLKTVTTLRDERDRLRRDLKESQAIILGMQ